MIRDRQITDAKTIILLYHAQLTSYLNTQHLEGPHDTPENARRGRFAKQRISPSSPTRRQSRHGLGFE